MFKFKGLNTEDTSKIVYDGKDIESLGIEKGMDFNEVLTKVNDNWDLDKDVSDLKDKISNLESKDVKYKGNTYNISRGTSLEGAKLLGNQAYYKVSNTARRNTLTFDTRDIKKPNDMSVRASRVKISGQFKGGKTSLINSDSRYRSLELDLDNYPLLIDVDIVVGTANGDINLRGTRQVLNSSDHEGYIDLEVEDNTGQDDISQGDFIELMAAKLTEFENRRNTLRNLEDDVVKAEAKQRELEDKLNQVESGGDIVTDDEGNVVNPNDNYDTLTERINALLKKN